MVADLPPPLTEFAPAKINLTLHVTGQRADGYHLLDSLVVFADVGDRITAEPDSDLSLQMTGPMARHLPPGDDNLVLRAARLMSVRARLTLEKHLPVASGIGGGSADAAATLRVLSRLTGKSLPAAAAVLGLGADVPVCLGGTAVRMQGVGEALTPVPHLPAAALVLVNPGVAVSTAQVFRQIARKDNPPMPQELPPLQTAAQLAGFLMAMRNDMEGPAQALAPPIAEARAALAGQSGCLAARMSGSGATCFGLFASTTAASAAAQALRTARPEWWVAPARMLS